MANDFRHCALRRLTPPFVFLLFGTSCPRQRSVGLERKNGKNSETGVSAAAGLSLLRPNQSAMANILLSGESTDKTKEAGTFAFLITDVIIPERMARVDVAGCLVAGCCRGRFRTV